MHILDNFIDVAPPFLVETWLALRFDFESSYLFLPRIHWLQLPHCERFVDFPLGTMELLLILADLVYFFGLIDFLASDADMHLLNALSYHHRVELGLPFNLHLVCDQLWPLGLFQCGLGWRYCSSGCQEHPSRLLD
jgi:hypothetical protein